MRNGKKKIKTHRQSDLKMLSVGSLCGEIMDNLQASAAFASHHKSFFLLWKEISDRRLELVNTQRRPDLGLPDPKSYIYNTTPAAEAQGTLARQGGAERF